MDGESDSLNTVLRQLEEAQRVAHVGSFEWDVAPDVVTWSDELYRIYGVEKGRFGGSFEAFLERVHPEDVALTKEVVFDAFRHVRPFTYDHRIMRSDGSVRVLHTRGDVIADAQGKPLRMVGSCWDVTDFRETTQRLERSLSLLDATINATADGLLVVDRAGRVTAWNGRLLDLWHVTREEVESRDFEELLAFVHDQLENGEACLRTVREMQARPEAESFDSLCFLDGRFFERYSRPQRIGDEIVGRVWSYRDVTERERLLRRATFLSDAAQEALRARDEFLSIAAHEIRGPLTSLHLAIQLLERGPLSADATAKALEVIQREDRRLARFVDELLDLGRIRAGQLQFTFEEVDLGEVLRGAVARLGTELARAGSSLSVSIEGRIVGRWDRSRLDQVVTNLLSNAIKFGLGKPIEVSVTAREGRATLLVRDQGIGIPPEMQERVFLPFERAVSVRHYGGLGLGLHIVRTIVDGLGGSLRMESAPGAGSAFFVELPLARAS